MHHVCRMNQIAHYAESEGDSEENTSLARGVIESPGNGAAAPGCRLGALDFRSFDENVRAIRAGEVAPGGVTRSPTAETWL